MRRAARRRPSGCGGDRDVLVARLEGVDPSTRVGEAHEEHRRAVVLEFSRTYAEHLGGGRDPKLGKHGWPGARSAA
jgi:hypothetical protein